MMKTVFVLDGVEAARANEFVKKQDGIYCYTGDDRYEYMFIPRLLGTMVRVYDRVYGATCDVTNYDSWKKD